MVKRALNFGIYSVFLFGIYGAGSLTFTEYSHNGTCPKIGVIPACYIVFACLLIPFISHILNKGEIYYFIFTSLVLAIATYGTVGQLLGAVQCPKTASGVPMCYISFGVFATLIILKILFLKKKK